VYRNTKIDKSLLLQVGVPGWLRTGHSSEHIIIGARDKLPRDYNGYNIVIVIVNHFSKRLFSIPYYKNIDTKEAARLYIYYVY
jgi:hypothetical protein